MKSLLEESSAKLLKPSQDARRKLMIVLNIGYLILVPCFLISEKISNGHFVPTPYLWWFVYLPALIANLLSAIYNIKAILYLRGKIQISKGIWKRTVVDNLERFDTLFSWTSFGLVMYMSFTSMAGVGNPSNDAILTDFALGHSLIIMAVIIIGRKGAFLWFLIVMGCLFFHVSQLGWNYKYHYLTPQEVSRYEKALEKKEVWAVNRQKELSANKLNPPHVTRYFNTWFIFILIAFLGSYFFSGVTIDILSIIPPVVNNINTAIQNSVRIETDIAKFAVRILQNNEVLKQLDEEISKLDIKDKKNLIGILSSIRKSSIHDEEDWESFKINFDAIHSDFFKYLERNFSELSLADMKLMAYIRLKLTSTQIARLLDIKVESLRTLRYRLKAKLNLDKNTDLYDYIDNINYTS